MCNHSLKNQKTIITSNMVPPDKKNILFSYEDYLFVQDRKTKRRYVLLVTNPDNQDVDQLLKKLMKLSFIEALILEK